MEITVGMKMYKTGQKLPDGSTASIELEVTKVTKTGFSIGEQRYTVPKYGNPSSFEEWSRTYSRGFLGVRLNPVEGEQVMTAAEFKQTHSDHSAARQAEREAERKALLERGVREAVSAVMAKHKGSFGFQSELEAIRKMLNTPEQIEEYHFTVEYALGDALQRLKSAAEQFESLSGNAKSRAEDIMRSFEQ